MGEEWRPISWAPRYEVSNLGRVKNKRGRVLRGSRGKHVHISYCLGKGRWEYGHRLVAEAFIGPIPDGAHVCHRDGDPSNNRKSNLRIDTPRGNSLDRFKHGTISNFKLTPEMVREIKAAKGQISHRKLAAKLGLSKSTVTRIYMGKTWSHI